jgi:hypothetical protein
MIINEDGEVVSIGKPLSQGIRYKQRFDSDIKFVRQHKNIDLYVRYSRGEEWLYCWGRGDYKYWYESEAAAILSAEEHGYIK